jgi:hypothetical protein
LHVRHDCLEPLGLSVTKGAQALGGTRQALNNLVNGKGGISAEMAVRAFEGVRRQSGGVAEAADGLRSRAGREERRQDQGAARLATGMIDATRQIRLFTKLKLVSCAPIRACPRSAFLRAAVGAGGLGLICL